MQEDRIPPQEAPSGEPPVPVPPVDQSWSLMRNALDARMPVTSTPTAPTTTPPTAPPGAMPRIPIPKPIIAHPSLWAAVALTATVTIVLIKTNILREAHSPHTTLSANHVTTQASNQRPTQHSAQPPTQSNTQPQAQPGALSPTPPPAPATHSTNTALPKTQALTSNDENKPPSNPPHPKNLILANSPQLTNRLPLPPHARRYTSPEADQKSTAEANLTAEANHNSEQSAIPRTISLAPRQTYPPKLAAITTTAAARTRFHLADSLLMKHSLRTAGPIHLSPTRPASTHTLTAGISVSNYFPLGQQQQYPFGVNGNRGTIADYTPALHLRAISGDNWDLQLGLRIIVPQYTHAQTIDSSGGDSSSIYPFQGYRQYNVYVLKKLYYSEISISLDRQIIKRLWLGAGLSFGRLAAAYGTQEILMKATNPGVSDTVYRSEAVNVKANDTAYNRLSKSEWRLLLTAEYRWRRWTAGLRYERSLHSYLTTPPDASKSNPINQALSLHLGYELWQRRH